MLKRVLLFSLFLALVATVNVSVTYAEGMQDDINRAVATIHAFRNMPDKSIPQEVLRRARGVAIITVIFDKSMPERLQRFETGRQAQHPIT